MADAAVADGDLDLRRAEGAGIEGKGLEGGSGGGGGEGANGVAHGRKGTPFFRERNRRLIEKRLFSLQAVERVLDVERAYRPFGTG